MNHARGAAKKLILRFPVQREIAAIFGDEMIHLLWNERTQMRGLKIENQI